MTREWRNCSKTEARVERMVVREGMFSSLSGTAAVSGDEGGVSGLGAANVDVEVFVVGGGAVHGLPGDVGATGAGPPGEDGIGLGDELFNGVEDTQETGVGKIGGGQEGIAVHFKVS